MKKIESERTIRVQVNLTPEEMSAIDEFRFENRMPTRAAAVRTFAARDGIIRVRSATIKLRQLRLSVLGRSVGWYLWRPQ